MVQSLASGVARTGWLLRLVAAALVAAAASSSDNGGFTLIMDNPGLDPVSLFWVSPDPDQGLSAMGSIGAGEGMSVNTFDGHKFGWKIGDGEMTTFVVRASMKDSKFVLPGIAVDGEEPKPPGVSPPVEVAATNKNLWVHRPKRVKRQDASDKVAETSKGIGGLSFRNLCNRDLTLYWRNPSGGYKFQGQLGPGESTGFQTYPGHQFIWSESQHDPPVPIGEFTIESYMIYPFVDETTTAAALAKLNEELDFREDYFEKHGFDWIGTTWPRPAPTLYMHRPSEVGETFEITINDTLAQHYHCKQKKMKACLDMENNRKAVNDQAYQEGPTTITIEVMSTHPRVFRIKNFLSTFECDYIRAQAKPMMKRSTTGHGKNIRVDNVRTSKSAWLNRGWGDVMDAIYRRIGLAMKIPQELVVESNIAENLNVLNYPTGSEYTPHYDVGADGSIASRWASGLLYLNTPKAGGGTSFPKAKMPDGSVGTYVDAVKGSFVFFYDLLEDGNVDMRSLHSGTSVDEGEKWVSPLWLWEPSRSGAPHGFGDLSTTAQIGPEEAPEENHDEL